MKASKILTIMCITVTTICILIIATNAIIESYEDEQIQKPKFESKQTEKSQYNLEEIKNYNMKPIKIQNYNMN
jgi:hypothetical protein